MSANAPLLRSCDYEDAPEENSEAFLYLEELARTRLYEAAEHDDNGVTYYPRRMEYVTKVAALAQAFEIPGIIFDENFSSFDNEYVRFLESVDYQTTQIHASRVKEIRKSSVQLSAVAKKKVSHHLEQIRVAVEGSNIAANRKKAILKKLVELEAEIVKQRSRAAPILMGAAFVLAIAADTNELAEPVARAANAIIKIVGVLRLEADVQELEKLPAPPLQIEAPKNIRPRRSGSNYDDLDEDIPF